MFVELKLRSLKKEDKAQIEFYMQLVDEQVKEVYHNKTIGIIITKESDEFIVNFVKSNDVIPLYYELKEKINLWVNISNFYIVSLDINKIIKEIKKL